MASVFIAIACRLMEMLEIFAYRTVAKSLKPFIVLGLSRSVKFVLPIGTQKLYFCVRPWSLITILNFSEGVRQTQRYFNVSTPSSRRDK